MASKGFSFRLPDEIVQFVESSQLEGETLNQTAQRLFIDFVKSNSHLSTELSAKLSTDVYNIEELIDKRLEIGLVEVRSQLDELRGKLKAR